MVAHFFFVLLHQKLSFSICIVLFTMSKSLPHTTRVFSRSSTSSARKMDPSGKDANSTAVAHSSKGTIVTSNGARKNAGQ